MSQEKLIRIAIQELEGVGNSVLGEWHEWTGKAYHVRRRLSEAEQRLVGPAVDVRGTEEGLARARAISVVRPTLWQLAMEEASL